MGKWVSAKIPFCYHFKISSTYDDCLFSLCVGACKNHDNDFRGWAFIFWIRWISFVRSKVWSVSCRWLYHEGKALFGLLFKVDQFVAIFCYLILISSLWKGNCRYRKSFFGWKKCRRLIREEDNENQVRLAWRRSISHSGILRSSLTSF